MKTYLARITVQLWLPAVVVLMVTTYACAAAQARSTDDVVRSQGSYLQSQDRKTHRRSDSSRASRRIKAKSKPGQTARAPSKKAAGPATVDIADVPLPQPRPLIWPEPHTFAEAAGPGFDTANVTSALSDCDQRLTEIAVIELLPRLIGPGECGGRDMIRLNAVLLPNHKRVEVKPTAVLRCMMAESFAAWVRDEASDHVAASGDVLRSVDTYGSYECRGRNWVAAAKLSEHGKGNAIDVRGLVLADGRYISLTDATVSKPLRDDLRDSACHRFTTVLGPGADGYHNDHIHLDSLERINGARICQWDVRQPPPPTAKVARGRIRLAARVALPQPRSSEDRTVIAGPWAIRPTYKANKLQTCAMSRSDGELGITFVRAQDGLSLTLESKKWKLERKNSFPVRLTAGSRSVNAKARAETKTVNVTLTDSRLNSRLRSVNKLQVHTEDATLWVPLDNSSTAFERLEKCFNSRGMIETNILMKRKASKMHRFVASGRKR